MSADTPRSILPGELTPPASGRRLLGELAAVVVLLAALDFAAIEALRRTDRGIQILEAKWALVREDSEPVDWLILGDSSGNQGLDPAGFGEALGGRALNACTLGDLGLADDAWLLAERIQRHGAPDNVVLVHAFDTWRRSGAAVRSWLAVTPVKPSALPGYSPPLAVTRSDRWTWFLQKWVPLYGRPYRLQVVLRHPDLLWTPLPPITPGGLQEIDEARPQTVRRDLAEQAEFYRSRAFRASEINRQALEAILALADEYDIEVYYAMAPLCRGLHDDEAFRDYLEAQIEYLGSWAERSPRFHLALEDPVLFPPEEMDAVDHVVGRDAVAVYTRAVAEGVRSARRLAAVERDRKLSALD